jgi:hypothetical protein
MPTVTAYDSNVVKVRCPQSRKLSIEQRSTSDLKQALWGVVGQVADALAASGRQYQCSHDETPK